MDTFLSLKRLRNGTWQAFERVIARYLEHGGFQGVDVVGGPGDRGADIVGSFQGRRWIIQAKYSQRDHVGSQAVKQVFEAQWDYDADVMVAATSQSFADSARRLRDRKRKDGFDIRTWERSFFINQGDSLPMHSAAHRELRSYQRDAVNAIHESIESGRSNSLVTLATGLGKTVVASTLIAEYLEKIPSANVLVMAHMNDLVRQLDSSCWSQFDKNTETHLWTDGERPAYFDGVTFATWQSISSAVDRGEILTNLWSLVVIDECHHAPSESYQRLISALNPEHLLGVTATPWRGDGLSLRPLFGDPIFSMDVVEGMQLGYLSKVDYQMMLDGIDWDEIRKLSVQGLSIRDLNTSLYVPERDIGMIASICDVIESTKNPRTLVFCRSISHAERLQSFFSQYDITARVLHSGMHKSERYQILNAFRAGTLRVLISIEMLNEGIDVPEVNIVVFARVTHSRRIFLQQLGRGLRLSNNKTHVKVLDYVADVRRVAAGIEINTRARGIKYKEDVSYPDGNIVHFSKYSQDFFEEYLADMADISDLDETSQLQFP